MSLPLAYRLIPDDPDQQAILRERAEKLARTSEVDTTLVENREYLQFEIGQGQLYGIPTYMLEKVLYAQQLTEVPCTPDFIAGIVRWQGMVLTVLDSQYLFNGKVHQQLTPLSRVIVVGSGDKIVGLLVDDIKDYVVFKLSELTENNATGGQFNPDYIFGVHLCSTVLINIDAILTDPRLVVS